jgi:hypothetical protein
MVRICCTLKRIYLWWYWRGWWELLDVKYVARLKRYSLNYIHFYLMQGYVNESEYSWMGLINSGWGIYCLPFRAFRPRIQGILQDIK